MKRREQITLKQLRALAAVVEYGTISQAADVLGLTGPAVHNQLKTLEDVVGASLLYREGKDRNLPTPEGEALLSAHEEIHATLGRALHKIMAIDAGLQGSVVIGVVSTAKYFAPGIVARLRAEMPGVDVVLKVGNRRETIEGLVHNAFDLCIMGRPPRSSLSDAVRLADHPHVVIAPVDHPLVGQADITPETLGAETFVMREEGSGTRILANRFLADLAPDTEASVIEMSSNETIKQAVKSGLGVALISAHTVAEELATGRLACLDLRGLPILRQWFLIQPPHPHAPAAVGQVAQYIIDHIDEILPDLSVIDPAR